MNKRVLLVLGGLVVIAGGLIYVKFSGQERGYLVGEQEKKEEVVERGGEVSRDEVKQLDSEVEELSAEIDQAINELSDELSEPDVNLNW